jgi:hypothetical protein
VTRTVIVDAPAAEHDDGRVPTIDGASFRLLADLSIAAAISAATAAALTGSVAKCT